MYDEALIVKAEEGDTASLVELDRQGLLIGADETLAEYAHRLRRLQANTAEMNRALAATADSGGAPCAPAYEVEGMRLDPTERIPQAVFDDVRAITEALYRFAIDWVPGFYTNPRFGWLFGGAAFHFYPDFFALFIVRKSFAHRERWLIYSRRELLSHELCHIARIGMASRDFEETFAYQTATTAFRRALGSAFHSQRDVFLFLCSVLVLLAAQIVRLWWLPAVPIWPFWTLVLGVMALLATRHEHHRRVLNRALAHVAVLAPQDNRAVLFRCTDAEIAALAGLTEEEALRCWVRERQTTSPRWRVITARFLTQASG